MNVFNADLGLVITRLALLLGLGWFLARQGWVVPASRQSLMRLVIWVFFPAMIFDRVCGNPLINSGTTALLYLGVGFGMIVTGILVGRLVAQALALPGDVCRRTFAFASGTNNFGYLGIPITAALFDRDVVGVLLVHNVGVEAAVWTVGISVLSGKPGLAGLRIGFAIGHPAVVDRISRVTGPYDINSFAVTAAFAALNDQAYVDDYVAEVIQARTWMGEQLRAAGVRHHVEGGNYLLLWPQRDPATLDQELREAGILVRAMTGKPLIDGSLRVSIGTLEQMQSFWAAYQRIEALAA